MERAKKTEEKKEMNWRGCALMRKTWTGAKKNAVT